MKTKIALCAATIALLSASVWAGPAKAGYVVDLTQQGANVIATGSGPIDLSGLTFSSPALSFAAISPNIAEITTGPTAFTETDLYTGFSGPLNFGAGSITRDASSGSGGSVGIDGGLLHELAVPQGYVSGAALSDTSTYLNASFASLGVTPGVYEWTWGTGGANQNFTLDIAAATVPEPATWATLLIGFAGLGLLGYRKTRLSPVNG
jgi:hypothetical protein